MDPISLLMVGVFMFGFGYTIKSGECEKPAQKIEKKEVKK